MTEVEPHRYFLRRKLVEGTNESMLFVMLNPSTADEHQDDPTIRRCKSFALREGLNLWVVNLFALRATNPRDLHRQAKLNMNHAIGGRSADDLIEGLSGRSAKVVCAWGVHGDRYPERVRFVVSELLPFKLWCLGTTESGQPRHPLMLKADTPFEPWHPPAHLMA